MSGKRLYIWIGVISGISFLLTLLNLFSGFALENMPSISSYTSFYAWLLSYLQQSQEPFYAIFRIPGVILFAGLLIYFAIFFAFALIRLPFLPLSALLAKRKKKEKDLTWKSFKAPSIAMFLKWVFVIVFLSAHIYLCGYYLNGIIHEEDVWLYYVIFYMYGILCALMVNIIFNLSKPLKSNPYFELAFALLLAAAFAGAYFFLDKFGVSLNYYIHACVIAAIFLLINALDLASIGATRCPKCHSKCVDTLIDTDWEEAGTSYGYETRSRKVGTRETTVTISDDHGNTVATGTGSEDIYENYESMYEINTTKYTYTYDSVCIHCHHHHKWTDISYKSSRS